MNKIKASKLNNLLLIIASICSLVNISIFTSHVNDGLQDGDKDVKVNTKSSVENARKLFEASSIQENQFETKTTLTTSIITSKVNPFNPYLIGENKIPALPKDAIIHNDILYGVVHVSSDTVWEDLLLDAQREIKYKGHDLITIEVGMHSADQCIMSAENGLQTYCFEPSPKSYQRIQDQIAGTVGNSRLRKNQDAPSKDAVERVHVYNKAVGPKSGETVEFTSSGGTGDHVGTVDMKSMGEKVNDAKQHDPEGEVMHVPTIALDDVILDQIKQNIYMLKVDTQGFEPSVFSGVTKSLSRHMIDYISFEYWPRGIDLLAGTKDECIASKLLQMLHDEYGYTLFQLTLIAHPNAGKKRAYVNKQITRPVDNFETNCQWYFDLENVIHDERGGDDSYRMGYWTDFLAVSPTKMKEIEEKKKTMNNELKSELSPVGQALLCYGDISCLAGLDRAPRQIKGGVIV